MKFSTEHEKLISFFNSISHLFCWSFSIYGRIKTFEVDIKNIAFLNDFLYLDDFQFNDFEVKIAPNSAALANIYPEAFKTCGNVQKLQSVQITVKFVDINDREYHAQTDDNGDYCLFLAPGDYTVNVSPSVSEFEKILWYLEITYAFEIFMMIIILLVF